MDMALELGLPVGVLSRTMPLSELYAWQQYAARRLLTMADNAAGIIAIELLAAAQGVDFHRPLRSSPALEAAHALLRRRVPMLRRDRYFAPDISAARELITSGALRATLSANLFAR